MSALPETIRTRLVDVQSHLARRTRDGAYAQLEQAIAEIEADVREYPWLICDDLWCEPLGHDPAITMMTLHRLDVCDLLCSMPGAPASLPPETLLYPTFRQTIARQLLAALHRIRCRLGGIRSGYDPPTLREVFYLRCPSWLEPAARFLLRVRLPSRTEPRRGAAGDLRPQTGGPSPMLASETPHVPREIAA